MPLLDVRTGITTSLTCPLNVFRHQFAVHESLKSARGSTRFTCEECGKTFRAENFLDDHMEARHSDMVPVHAVVCAHHYCDILGCDCSIRCDDRRLAKVVAQCNEVMRSCSPNEETFVRLSEGYCQELTCESLTAACEEEWVLIPWLKALAAVSVLVVVVVVFVWRSFEEDDIYKDD